MSKNSKQIDLAVDDALKKYEQFHGKIVNLRNEQKELLRQLERDLSEKDMAIVREKLKKYNS